MKYLLFLFSLIFFFFSCKNNEGEIVYYDTYIYGNVTDYFTGKPIQGLIMDVEYNDEYHGMSFGGSSTTRVLEKAASITDANGYYRIPIAKKVGVGGENYDYFEHVVIKPNNNLKDYYFEEGEFDINYVDTSGSIFYQKSHRINVRAKSKNDYGFVKIYYNPIDTVSYSNFQGTYSFSEPHFHELITLDTFKGQDYNYYLIKVPLLENERINVFKNHFNYEFFSLYYTLENRLDTVSFSIL